MPGLTYISIYISMCMPVHLSSQVPVGMSAYVHICMPWRTGAHMPRHMFVCMPTCRHACLRTCLCMSAHVSTNTSITTHIYKCVHARAYAHFHTHIPRYMFAHMVNRATLMSGLKQKRRGVCWLERGCAGVPLSRSSFTVAESHSILECAS